MKRTIKEIGILAGLLICFSFSATACTPGNTADFETPPHITDPDDEDKKPGDKDEKSIRLVAYNVGVFNKDASDPGNYVTIANMMKELEADVVFLNEVDKETNRTGKVDQLRRFAQLMGWEYCYGPAMDYQGGQYGEGIAVKNPIVNSYYVPLAKGEGAEARVLVVIELEDMVVATTHLDHVSDAARVAQAVEINNAMVQKYANSSKPVFLGGDLNALPTSATLTEFKKHWKVISRNQFTFPADKPTKTIDFVLQLNNGVSCDVITSDVVTWLSSGDVTKSSDHLPIYVDIKLKK